MNTLILALLLMAPTTFTDQVVVHLVNVDAVVTDTSGHQVLGLTPEDFSVYDNGKPVKINTLEYYSVRHPVTPNPAVHHSPLPCRRFVVVIQEALDLSDFTTIKNIRRDLKTFFANRFKPEDQVAIFTFKSRWQCLFDFTDDRSLLPEALGGTPDYQRPLPVWFKDRENLGREKFIDALPHLAAELGHVEGRKEMILFSRGFEKLSNSKITSPTGDYAKTRQFEKLIETLNDSNVAVHVIDLYHNTGNTMESMLTEIAERTGGGYYAFWTTPLVPLREIEKRSNGYYLLAYYADVPPDEHGYREITVKVKDPTLRVQAREGYRY